MAERHPTEADKAVAIESAEATLSGHGYVSREKRCSCGRWRLDQHIAVFPEPQTPGPAEQWNRHLAEELWNAGVLSVDAPGQRARG